MKRKITLSAFLITLAVSMASLAHGQSASTSLQVYVTGAGSSGLGVISPTGGTAATGTVSAGVLAAIEPSSSGSGYVSGTLQLLVSFSGSSVNPPTVTGYIQYGWYEVSSAYAHNGQAGGSASGSSYTYATSNSASVGVGTDDPTDDYYFTATPDPSTNITTGATMSGSGSSWTYIQDLTSAEASATASLSGMLGGAHNSGSGSASQVASISYSNVIVTTH